MTRQIWFCTLTILALLGLSSTSWAAEAVDSGITSWMLTSTALVLLMVPGLAMFYGGLVRTKNVLGTMMHMRATLCAAAAVVLLAGCASNKNDQYHSQYGYGVTIPSDRDALKRMSEEQKRTEERDRRIEAERKRKAAQSQ